MSDANGALSLGVPPELVAAIAEQAAAIVLERRAEPDGFLGVAGAAEFLACKPSRIYALSSAGRIPHHHDGSRLLFDRAELREWVRCGGGIRT